MDHRDASLPRADARESGSPWVPLAALGCPWDDSSVRDRQAAPSGHGQGLPGRPMGEYRDAVSTDWGLVDPPIHRLTQGSMSLGWDG